MTLLLDPAKNPSAYAHRSPALSWKSRLSALVIAVLVFAGLFVVGHDQVHASTQHTAAIDCNTNPGSASHLLTRNVQVNDTIVISSSSCTTLLTDWRTTSGSWWTPVSGIDTSSNAATFPVTVQIIGSSAGSLSFVNSDGNWHGLTIGIVTPPTSPTSFAGSVADSKATLSWSGQTNITDPSYFEIQQSPDNSTWSAPSGSCSGQVSGSPCEATVLTNGTSYHFRIRVVASNGTSPWKNLPSPVTPSAPPPAPTGVSGVAGNAQVTLSWAAPTMDSSYAPISGYKIEVDDGNGWGTSIANTSSTATSAVVTLGPADQNSNQFNLRNGNSYSFRISAINTAGAGSSSIASAAVIPFTVPDPVDGFSIQGNLVSGSTDTLDISWQAPSDGGRVITKYEVEIAPDPGALAPPSWSAPTGGTCTSQNLNATSCTISSLSPGTPYVVQIRAENGAGWGSFSNRVSLIIPGPAAAPPNLQSTAGDQQVALSWGLPTSWGTPQPPFMGFNYDLEQSTDNGTSWVHAGTVTIPGLSQQQQNFPSTSSFTVTGLTNGASYDFRVSAVTSYGNGLWSTLTSVAPSTTPGAPATVRATRGDTEVLLSWSAGANGGSAITGYLVEKNDGNGWTTVTANTNSASTTYTVTGLTNGTAYAFRITAENTNGRGSLATASNSATPVALPGQPSGLSATMGNGQVSLSWTPGASSGTSLTGHFVEFSTDGGASWSTAITDTGSTAGSATVSGLINGSSYLFRVAGISSAGTGLPLALSSAVAPSTIPSSATGLSATVGNQQAVLSWSAGANGGSAITGYLVEKNDGNGWTTVTANTNSASTTYTVTGLTNGTSYDFRVTPLNANGSSANPSGSLTNPVTPIAPPGAPPAPTAVAGAGTARISVVSGTGGPPSTYTVTASPGNRTCTVSGASGTCTITGLTPGQAYTFTTTATNAAGSSSASSSSAPITTTPPKSPVPSSPPPSPTVSTAPSQISGTVLQGIRGRIPVTSPRRSSAQSTLPGGSTTTPGPIVRGGSQPLPPSRPVVMVEGRETVVETRISGLSEVTLQSGSFQLGLSLNQESGGITTNESGGAELAVTQGSGARLQGAGLRPGGVVSIFLPSSRNQSTPLSTIQVAEDGSFSGEAIFSSSALSEPVPIGRNLLQLVSTDEDGNEIVLEMAINIAQGLPIPELNREVGNIPQLAVGQTLGTSAGIPTDVSVTAIEEQSLAVVEGEGWTMAVSVENTQGSIQPSNSGALVTLVRDEAAQVVGSGFMPGTRAEVWLFSEPTLLGTVTVDDNGKFTGAVNIDGRLIAPGEHTLQLQGVGVDGFIKAANLGVSVADDHSSSSIETSPTVAGWVSWSMGILLVVAMSILVILRVRQRKNA